MKARIKIILYYIIELSLSLIFLITFLLAMIKMTVFNQNYIINIFNKNNYYDKVYEYISNDMAKYILQSGLENVVLEDIYTKDMIKDEVKEAVNAFYTNKEIKVDTSVVEKNLKDNIENYLASHNIMVADEQALDRFVSTILRVYRDKITITSTDTIVKLQQYFVKINKILNILLVSFLLVIIALSLIIHFVYKKLAIAIPMITSSLLLLLSNLLILKKINVNHIMFLNDNVSLIMKKIFNDISSIIKYGSIILIILALIIIILYYIISKNNKKKIVHKK